MLVLLSIRLGHVPCLRRCLRRLTVLSGLMLAIKHVELTLAKVSHLAFPLGLLVSFLPRTNLGSLAPGDIFL